MSVNRNENGYDISAQNYFEELGCYFGKPVEPITRQSVSDARTKLKWEAFEYLLGAANREDDLCSAQFRYKGHVTRAIDGTYMNVPRTEELLRHFTVQQSPTGNGHYPSALMVTATNVFTGQPIAARVTDRLGSEHEGLKHFVRSVFKSNDLSLLDRLFGYPAIFLEFEKAGQYYLSRVPIAARCMPLGMKAFLKSKLRDTVLTIPVVDQTNQQQRAILVRLVRGPKDHEGKRIVFATNLIDSRKYSRRSLVTLYCRRWTIETFYGRVKTLFKVERFHGRSYNSVMQEIFANLLALSLIALVWAATIEQEKLNAGEIVPSFKNTTEVIRRHLFDLIDHAITRRTARILAQELILQTKRVLWKKQPGRSFCRISMQPVNKWTQKKAKKLAEFKNARKNYLN